VSIQRDLRRIATTVGVLAVASCSASDPPAVEERPAEATTAPVTSPVTSPATPVTAPVTAATTAPTTPATPPRLTRRALDAPAQVVTGVHAPGLAIAASRALLERAPVVVIAAGPDPLAEDLAAPSALARDLGAPLLLSTTDKAGAATLASEVARLGATTVVPFTPLPPAVTAALDPAVEVVDPGAAGRLPVPDRPAAPPGTVALVSPDDATAVAAAATASAVGLPVVPLAGTDPRSPDGRARLAELQATQVVALGAPGRFPGATTLAGLVRTAVAGPELPGGGQILFPGRRLVALYGHPGDANLGLLGELPVDGAVGLARQYAAAYQRVSAEVVVPAFELITTVAAAEAGSDGNFSAESSIERIRPWVEAAGAAGLYVVLDLQPGFTDFLTQARRYEELLALPHVGLALDPEWRLAPGQQHLRDIGSVSAREVNATAQWLAGVVRAHGLPQKLLIVHQFRLDMISDREQIAIPPELALVFQMDGLGPQARKLETWRAVTARGPAGAWFGWKNFIDEDVPLRAIPDTVALTPTPLFISYQ
jgi:hypothetical protein